MKTTTILTIAAAFGLATTAHAGDMYGAKTKSKTYTQPAQVQQTQTTTANNGVSVQTLDGAVITATAADQQYAVLGTVARNGQTLYRVQGEDGREFLNHVPDAIVPVTTDVDVLDTVQVQYQGRTFTNRIVRDDADSVG